MTEPAQDPLTGSASRFMRPLWTHSLLQTPRGLLFAREQCRLLVWDEQSWLYLFNLTGNLQSQRQFSSTISAGSCADDGSAFAIIEGDRTLHWLAPDLSTRWQITLPRRALALALDPFGQYVAVSDEGGNVEIFNRLEQRVSQVEVPRPLEFLSFVPAAPFLIGSSDYGLVACLDFTGRIVWRDGLVAHVGGLTVSGEGTSILLACFTHGLQGYSLAGQKLNRSGKFWPCRLASVSFDGRYVLAGGLTRELMLLSSSGQLLGSCNLDEGIVGLALSALADRAFVALGDGKIQGLEIRLRR